MKGGVKKQTRNFSDPLPNSALFRGQKNKNNLFYLYYSNSAADGGSTDSTLLPHDWEHFYKTVKFYSALPISK